MMPHKLIIFISIIFLSACSPFSINTGLGGAYVNNVPETHITGHEQFHLSLEVEKPITENLSSFTGWNHYSNGSKLGMGKEPNHGLDFFGTRFVYKFKF